MRMDIEYSPGARGQRRSAAARDDEGPAAGILAGGEGRMSEKRLCSMGHPAACGERAGRFFNKRTMGVLWRHSSVNLVEPRSIAPAAAVSPAIAGDQDSVSTGVSAPQPPLQFARLAHAPSISH
jgi:hypothetical protein